VIHSFIGEIVRQMIAVYDADAQLGFQRTAGKQLEDPSARTVQPIIGRQNVE
jgi:hypothetical protein